ncbi:hypothetical protein [Bartonella sp. AD24XZML]
MYVFVLTWNVVGELGCAFVNETVICEVNKGYLVGKRLDYSLQTGAG